MSDQTAPPPVAPAGLGYASWLHRVGAYVVDGLLTLPASAVQYVGFGMMFADARTVTDPVTGTQTVEGFDGTGLVVVLLGGLLALVIALWNQVWRQGRTGWSVGKQTLGIRLVKADTGAPIGPVLCFVRSIVHVVDALPCFLGFLWPLWDPRRQTFADKIMTTVVVRQRRP